MDSEIFVAVKIMLKTCIGCILLYQCPSILMRYRLRRLYWHILSNMTFEGSDGIRSMRRFGFSGPTVWYERYNDNKKWTIWYPQHDGYHYCHREEIISRLSEFGWHSQFEGLNEVSEGLEARLKTCRFWIVSLTFWNLVFGIIQAGYHVVLSFMQ